MKLKIMYTSMDAEHEIMDVIKILKWMENGHVEYLNGI